MITHTMLAGGGAGSGGPGRGERRSHRRHPLSGPVTYRPHGTAEISRARGVDIGPGGLTFAGERPLAPGTGISLGLERDGATGRRPGRVTAAASVVRCRPDGRGGFLVTCAFD